MKRTLAAVGSLLLVAALGVALPVVLAPSASATVACGFTGSYIAPQNIPDGGSVTSTQDLSSFADGDPITDVDVILNITHPFDSDLAVSLSSRGETVLLTSRRGFSGDNYTTTRFDDGAATRIRDGSAPFTGSFRPEQSLNVFDDLVLGAVWTLTVSDAVPGEAGTLQSWSLVFKTQWCSDADRDSVKDADDLCPSVKGVLPHGCPVRARSVSLTFNNAAKEFRGVLRCPAAPECAHGQPVRIYKVAAGTDPLVARIFATDTGTFAYPRANAAGTYYAVAPKVVEEGVAECSRAQSPNLVV